MRWLWRNKRRFRKLKRRALKNGTCESTELYLIGRRIRKKYENSQLLRGAEQVKRKETSYVYLSSCSYPFIVQPLFRKGRKTARVIVLGFAQSPRPLEPPSIWSGLSRIGDVIDVPLGDLCPTAQNPFSAADLVSHQHHEISKMGSYWTGNDKEKFKERWTNWLAKLQAEQKSLDEPATHA